MLFSRLMFSSKLILFFVLVSCEDENFQNPIPNVEIDIEVDMNMPQYDINIDDTRKISNANYRKLNNSFLGYRDNGVLIYRLEDNRYQAYDATCPYGYQNDNNVSLELKGNYVKCPDCQSEYYFVNEGFPTNKSVATSPLKRYLVTNISYKNLRIYNR